MNTINRVQTLADERGLTLCQLSKICDLSEATIRTAKKRGNQLSVDTIERICEALDISLSEFLLKPYPNKFAIRMSVNAILLSNILCCEGVRTTLSSPSAKNCESVMPKAPHIFSNDANDGVMSFLYHEEIVDCGKPERSAS